MRVSYSTFVLKPLCQDRATRWPAQENHCENVESSETYNMYLRRYVRAPASGSMTNHALYARVGRMERKVEGAFTEVAAYHT